MEPIIEIKNITKTYELYDKPVDRLKEALSIKRKSHHQEYHAINNVSLNIEKGESVGIVGTNGAGKSTILKMITGVLKPTSGQILVHGRIAALLELGAGFNMEYTGIENIYLNGTMMGYKKNEIAQKVDPIVEFADIGDFINQPVKTYSSGMFARLAFALAINVEPDILIVDEALSVGDTRFQVKCIDKMKELKSKGTTILFVSHATEQIKRFCNRAIWMEHGQVKMDGESSQIVDIYENYMKFGVDIEALTGEKKGEEIKEEKIEVEEDNRTIARDIIAAIEDIKLEKIIYHTFDNFKVTVSYEIFEEKYRELFSWSGNLYSGSKRICIWTEYIFGKR